MTSTTERYTLRSAVYLLLIKDGKVLLSRRANSGWRDGEYSLIAGHLDPGESLQSAMLREAQEESGISIAPRDLKFAHVMHHKEEQAYIDFFFTADTWQGEPHICEPDKCDGMQWFPLDALPDNVVPNVREAIRHVAEGNTFSELGLD